MGTKMTALLLGILVSMSPSSSRAADADVAPLKTKLIVASLFKNGVGFMTREAELPGGDVKMLVEGLPAPAHGTFWVYPRGTAVVRDLVAFERESSQSMPALSVAELLEANVGETVEVRLSGKDTIQGTIVAVPANRPAAPPSTSPGRYPHVAGVQPGETASLVLVQTANGMVALNKKTIEHIIRVGGPLKTTVDRLAKLFEGRFAKGSIDAANYDATPDGQRFLMVPAGQASSSPTMFHVLVNWVGTVGSTVPARR